MSPALRVARVVVLRGFGYGPRVRLPDRCRTWLCMGVLCLQPALAQPAGAQPAGAVSLSWVRLAGAEACVGGAALAAAVRERVGSAALFDAPDRAERLVEGHVARLKGAFIATFRVTDRDGRMLGERQVRVEGDGCDALTRPAVLVLSLIVKPDGAGTTASKPAEDLLPDLDVSLAALPRRPLSDETAAGDTATAPAGPPTPAVPRPGDASEPPTDPGVGGLRFGVRLAAVGEVGRLPSPSPAVSVGVVMDVRDVVRLAAEAGATASQDVRGDTAQAVDDGLSEGQVTLAIQPLWGALLVCPPDDHRDGFSGTICLRAAATRLALSLRGPTALRSLSQQRWLVQAGLRAGARRRWSGLAVWAELGFGVALRRDTLQFLERSGERQSLFRPEPINMGAHLGMEMTF